MSTPAKDAIGRGRSVLIVEDELFIAIELKVCLEEAGFWVLGPVGSVRDALSLISRKRPDTAVLDVNLGRETVIPVAEQLNLLHVPFVVASASDATELEQYKALSNAHNVGKPTNLAMLVAAMNAL